MPEEKQIEWCCYEHLGIEIHAKPNVLPKTEVEWKDFLKEPLKDPELKPGTEVLIWGFGGLALATIVVEKNTYYAETASSIWPLEYATDDRKCWTSLCEINKKAIKKLTLSSTPDK
jgi:hypothetical protein